MYKNTALIPDNPEDTGEDNCTTNHIDMLTDEGSVNLDIMMKTENNSCSDNLYVPQKTKHNRVTNRE